MKNKYGHVGIVIGSRIVKSPCCNAEPEEVKDEVIDEDNYSYHYVCSKCKKEYDAQELDMI